MSWKLFPVKDFDVYLSAWDNLNRKGPNTPLLDSRFVQPLIHNFGSGFEKIAINGDMENPIAMVIIAKQKLGVWSTFQPSQAPLGLWLCSQNKTYEELLPSLASSLPSYPLVLGVTQQDPHLQHRPVENGGFSSIDYIETSHVNVNRSFDEYWQSRGKNLRHNLKRQRNRLEREGTRVSLQVVTHSDGMLDAVHQYGILESSGWKNKIGSAVHIDNTQGKFYIEALSNLAKIGKTRVYRYFYDDKLVASDLCVIGGGSLIILKTAYDETIETTSPTMLMRQEIFQSLFEEQLIQRIEFYGRVMDWHTKWLDEIRVMYHVNYYPWKIVYLTKCVVSKILNR